MPRTFTSKPSSAAGRPPATASSLGKRKKSDAGRNTAAATAAGSGSEDEDARMLKYLGKKLGIASHRDERKLLKSMGLDDLFEGISAGAKYGLPEDFVGAVASDDEAPSEEDNGSGFGSKRARGSQGRAALSSDDSGDDSRGDILESSDEGSDLEASSSGEDEEMSVSGSDDNENENDSEDMSGSEQSDGSDSGGSDDDDDDEDAEDDGEESDGVDAMDSEDASDSQASASESASSDSDDDPTPPPTKKKQDSTTATTTTATTKKESHVPLFRPSAVLAARQQEAGDKKPSLPALAVNPKLERQVRGHVNRLSDQTMESIVKAVAQMFEENSRNEMIELVSREVITAVVRVPRNTYIPVYAAFIAALAIQSESDLGPVFVENVALQFKKAFDGGEEQNDHVRNLAMLLAHLYMFEVVTATLVYDIIKLLANTLRENDMEVLLALFNTVGTALRGDDPLALKEVITLVHQRAGEQQARAVAGATENLRVKFMLETLRDLKNNKRKLAADSFQIQTLTKTVRHIRTTKGASKSTLEISLDDLLNAETRGRWWRVGAAWAGHSARPLAGSRPGTSQDEDKLSQLAHAQRMNTPLRRQIFLAIMESEDCVHAFERVMKLGLKEKQERDIVHVLLDCCAQEKSYNPFYALLAQKLCDYHRRFQFTFQLRFWDYIKEMTTSDYPLRKLSNLSRCLAHLFGTFALSLSILKAAPLEAPAPRQITFLQGVFTALFVQFSEEVVSSAFARLQASMELALLRDSISVFLKQFVKPKDKEFPIPLTDEQKEKVLANMKVAKRHLG